MRWHLSQDLGNSEGGITETWGKPVPAWLGQSEAVNMLGAKGREAGVRLGDRESRALWTITRTQLSFGMKREATGESGGERGDLHFNSIAQVFCWTEIIGRNSASQVMVRMILQQLYVGCWDVARFWRGPKGIANRSCYWLGWTLWEKK